MILVPAVVFDHMYKFNDIFALLVFLTGFECVFLKTNNARWIDADRPRRQRSTDIFPAEQCFATFTIDIRDFVKTREQHAFFGSTRIYIDTETDGDKRPSLPCIDEGHLHGIEEVRSALTALK